MLFSAFEKHQYYNIKDLVDITKQPVVCTSCLVIQLFSVVPIVYIFHIQKIVYYICL